MNTTIDRITNILAWLLVLTESAALAWLVSIAVR